MNEERKNDAVLSYEPVVVATGEEAEAAAREKALRKNTRRRRTLRRVVPAVIAAVLYLVLAFFMFGNAAGAARGGVAVSLRYTAGLAAEQAASAKHTIANPEFEAAYAPSFWVESPIESITSTRGTQTTPALFVDGDIPSVLKVDFITGAYPSVLEKQGLALSEGLAWALLGGIEVRGATLEWYGQTYTVCGVFAGDEPMLLAQVDAKTSPVPLFTGVELTGEGEGDPRESAADFAQKAGLGEPEVIVDVRTVPMMIGLMAWLPAIVLGIWFLVQGLKMLRHLPFWVRQVVWLGLLLAAALLLPKALDLLPGWMIPSQWSDLDHWSEFFKTFSERLTQTLSLTPNLQDVALKRLLIGQMLLLIPALYAMTTTIRLWGRQMRRKDLALRRKALALAEAAADGDGQQMEADDFADDTVEGAGDDVAGNTLPPAEEAPDLPEADAPDGEMAEPDPYAPPHIPDAPDIPGPDEALTELINTPPED